MWNGFYLRRIGRGVKAALLCCCALLWMCAGALAQGLPPMSHQAWSADEGAPVSGVHQILQTADGYIWLATEGGAVRFDGSSFTVFRHETQPAIPDNDLTAIAQDGSGALWVGTADGLAVLRRGEWRREGAAEGWTGGAVTAMAVADHGSLLVASAAGLLRFDGRRFAAVAGAPSGVGGLAKLRDGSVLVLGDQEAMRFEHGASRAAMLPFSAAEALLDVQSGTAGALWARSAKSVFFADGKSKREWDAAKELAAGRVTGLLLGQDGRAWVGTNRGLYAVNGGGEAKAVEVPALHGESVSALFEDREGNVWVGTENSGLHVLRPRVFRSEGAAAGEAVTAVVTASDGVVWFGTRGDGLHVLGADRLRTPVPAEALTSPFTLSLARGAHGEIWAGTPDGLNRVRGRRVDTFTAATGLPDDFVRSVAVDAKGTVWAGTRRGLARFDGTAWTTLTAADGLGSDSIGPLLAYTRAAQSEPELWVGTSAGLSRVKSGHVESFVPQGGASSAIVTALSRDGGDGLWVGLHGAGISHFQNGVFQKLSLNALPLEIVAILRDGDGSLWIRGLRGVSRVRESELLQCARTASECKAHVAVYGTVDGLPSDALAAEGTSAAWRGDNGALWFATRAGLAVADPKDVVFNALPPPVAIERMEVDDADVPIAGSEIQVQPGHNRYVFDFAALSFTAPSKNRYRYMLEGFDRDWIDAGGLRSASYTNLPARHFVFRVQAANNDGIWNREGAAIRFRVLPPFYRRWWFYLLAVFVLSGVAFGIYQLRVLSLQRRFDLVLHERNRVAREVHDTLAQDFVSVSLQLDLASAFLKGKQVEAAQTQLQETRKLVKNGLEEARQSIWNLRANTAEDSLPARLTELVKRYAQADFRVRLKMGGAYHPIPAQIESEVFRIAQESLSNVERHARANEAAVELHYEQTALRLSVKDNGHGFALEEARALQGHYGLRGMQERAEAIGGQFTIQSEPGEGTRVTLLVSLPEREGART